MTATADQTELLSALVEISREYGSDQRMVIAGGGNTSVKDGDTLHVKASGNALGQVTADSFVALDRSKLQALAETEPEDDKDAREARYKAAIMGARLEPERGQRPSVECLFHHLMPQRFVIHTHATLVNTITCCSDGAAITKELFGDDVLWLPYVDPGFVLSVDIKRSLDAYMSEFGRDPKAIFMANHGLIVGGEGIDEIRKTTRELLDAIEAKLPKGWIDYRAAKAAMIENPRRLINMIGPMLRGLLAGDADGSPLKCVTFDDSDAAKIAVGCDDSKALVEGGPLTPDQIVYGHSFPLWVAVDAEADEDVILVTLRKAVEGYREAHGVLPKVVLAKGVGVFTIGDDYKAAAITRDVYLDAVRVMAGADALGGVSYLDEAQRKFIEDWEVEAFRKKVAAAGSKKGRMSGKVVVVTGGAQGFGLEIARGLVDEDATVVLTDLNVEGARQQAAEICEEHGVGRALGLGINVTDSQSIADCLHDVVRTYGGFDVMISNAGVLKAESVKTQPLKDFEFVTKVNYTGYFLVTQGASPILATQHKARPSYLSDIIQINSKSGMVGSNRNGAYAGSKFGGIGLTQSFALELIEDGVKVNSICPGNFFDGPLWSDPEKGLFVQYLRTGKVPGAKTIEDVKKAYEEKVPMKRGCRGEDVVRAIMYIVEQQYETGQAVPVTGGQVMVSS